MNMQYPDVESMICQMIMIGLKGSNKKDIANFMETLPSQDIGGVILYDEDLTSKDISTKNIIDSNQLKEFTFFFYVVVSVGFDHIIIFTMIWHTLWWINPSIVLNVFRCSLKNLSKFIP